ncbi:MAG: TatD family hydrolase [Gammaproteobacteria bacterium]|nr:TatD family hydrolase [Gammaproteobacteria bacterium]MDH5799382.1 TatD family hydrolase [Gammaproteobacteria bacterium]
MSTLLVDSHCHLDCLELQNWDNGVSGVLADAREHGVGHFLCVSIELDAFPGLLEMASAHQEVSVSMGVHPNVKLEQEPELEQLIQLGRDDRVVAIGETGLDYFRSEGDLEWQRERLRRHIRAAKELNKPLIIHNRESSADTMRILREEGADSVGGVMHCFVEDWETAVQAMELNFYISFSGIVTFKSATELQQVAKKLPLEKMLVETDSPYLAPVPFRGKKNQPAYVRYVAQHIADLRSCHVDEIAAATSYNFFQLFKGAVPTF